MAEEGTFCNNADVKRKAGAGVSSVSSAEAYTNDYITQAESYINAFTRHNFTDTYAALNNDVKFILKEATSNLAAIYAIMYDFTGYPSRIDAENKMQICWLRMKHCLRVLKDQKVITYINNA